LSNVSLNPTRMSGSSLNIAPRRHIRRLETVVPLPSPSRDLKPSAPRRPLTGLETVGPLTSHDARLAADPFVSARRSKSVAPS